MILHRRLRWASVIVSLSLAACGGGGGGGGEGPPVLVSEPAEFSRCAVPEQVSIIREDEGAAGWKTNRYLKFAGQPLTKLVPGPGMASTKNPEGVLSHGPLHAQNCTPGTGVSQTMSFRLRTHGFFDTGVGDHLAFGLRANYPTANALGNEKFDGIGLILHESFGGAMAERFRFPGGNDLEPVSLPQVELRDNTAYLVEMVAGTAQVSYRVTLEASGQTTGWRQYQQPASFAPMPSGGFLLAVLCRDANGQCEPFNTAFKIEFWDIMAGWSAS